MKKSIYGFAMAAAIRVAIVPVIFPIVFLGLELLFGAIQALVFALLTLIYITLATAGGHDDAAHGHGHAADRAHGPAAAPSPGTGRISPVEASISDSV